MVKRKPKFTPSKKDRDNLNKSNRSLRVKEKRLNLEFGKSMNFNVRKMSDFKDRADFNEYIEQSKYHRSRSTHRYVKNIKGVVIPRSEYNRAKRQDNAYQRTQKRALQKARNLPMKSGGKQTKWTVGDFDNDSTMGRKELDHLKMPQFNFDNIENMREWELKQRVLENRADKEYLKKKNTTFKDNYLTALEKIFGSGTDEKPNMSKDDIGYRLYNHIKNMSLDEFIAIYISEFDVSIGFIYNSQLRPNKLNRLHEVFGIPELNHKEWTTIVADDFDDDFDEFSPENYW